MAKLLPSRPSRPFKLTCGLTHKGASQVAMVVKNLPANADEMWVRSLRGGHGNRPRYSCLENPMDRGDWQATLHRVPKR